MPKLVRGSLGLLLLAATGCVTPGVAPVLPGRPDLLTEEQLREDSHATVYEVVQNLRPNWLRTRGRDSIMLEGRIQVYVDNIRYGDVGALQQIPTISVYYVRWYDGITASGRWGLNHGNGVIYVATAPQN